LRRIFGIATGSGSVMIRSGIVLMGHDAVVCRVQTDHPLTGAAHTEHRDIRALRNQFALLRKDQAPAGAVSAPDRARAPMAGFRIARDDNVAKVHLIVSLHPLYGGDLMPEGARRCQKKGRQSANS
jgi:hypothetical protein